MKSWSVSFRFFFSRVLFRVLLLDLRVLGCYAQEFLWSSVKRFEGRQTKGKGDVIYERSVSRRRERAASINKFPISMCALNMESDLIRYNHVDVSRQGKGSIPFAGASALDFLFSVEYTTVIVVAMQHLH